MTEILSSLDDTNTILFLVWARQVGKTTLLKSLLSEWHIEKDKTVFLLWDHMQFEWIETYESLLAYIQLQSYNLKDIKYLIIDEAQYIKNIGLILKVFIDKIRLGKYHIKLIVSGSGSLNVFKGMTDSLIWRKKVIHIHPFSFEEFLQAKNISYVKSTDKNINTILLQHFKEYIQYGWYPAVVTAPGYEDKQEIFSTLLYDYLQKDVSMMLHHKELVNFKKFLTIIAKKVGTVFSIQQIVEEMWVSRYILEKYFWVIENSFLLHQIHPRSGWKIAREMKKKTKVYFADTGILHYLLWIHASHINTQWKLVENFVCNEIKSKINKSTELLYRSNIAWWEVDFLMYNQLAGTIIPVEVKSWNKTQIPKSMSHFLDTYKEYIPKAYITTETAYAHRNKWLDIEFIPYVQISNYIF